MPELPEAERARRQIEKVLGRGSAPIKARLLDQGPVAGVGNLLADETLWRARLAPQRPAVELSAAELATLHDALRGAIADAVRLGGVHKGEIIPHRTPGGACPRCGTGLQRGRVGGRTTWWWWCPSCQV